MQGGADELAHCPPNLVLVTHPQRPREVKNAKGQYSVLVQSVQSEKSEREAGDL